MKLVNIGYGNMVSAERIITIVSSESAPIKRLIQEARDDGCNLTSRIQNIEKA